MTRCPVIDQLKDVYIDGELEIIDTSLYYPKILRKDYTVALNNAASGPDPDPILDAQYGCGSSLNLSDYCNPEVDKLIEQQSREGDPHDQHAPVASPHHCTAPTPTSHRQWPYSADSNRQRRLPPPNRRSLSTASPFRLHPRCSKPRLQLSLSRLSRSKVKNQIKHRR